MTPSKCERVTIDDGDKNMEKIRMLSKRESTSTMCIAKKEYL